MDRNILEILDEVNDKLNTLDVVLPPPGNDPFVSGAEENDDVIGFAGNINLSADATGVVEIRSTILAVKVMLMNTWKERNRIFNIYGCKDNESYVVDNLACLHWWPRIIQIVLSNETETP